MEIKGESEKNQTVFFFKLRLITKKCDVFPLFAFPRLYYHVSRQKTDLTNLFVDIPKMIFML